MDPGWEGGIRRGVINIVGEVGQECLARAQTGHDQASLPQAEVGVVRTGPEAVDDERIQPAEQLDGRLGDVAAVGEIGELADTVAENLGRSVEDGNRDDLDALDVKGTGDGAETEPGHVQVTLGKLKILEHVGPAGADGGKRLLVPVERDDHAVLLAEGAEVVDAVQVVGMVVGEKHGIDPVEALAHRLHAQFSGRIHQQIEAFGPDENGGPGPLVAWVRRAADIAITADHWHAVGRTGAKKEDFQRRLRHSIRNQAGTKRRSQNHTPRHPQGNLASMGKPNRKGWTMDALFCGTREAPEEGRFYPASPTRLTAQIADFLAGARQRHLPSVRAVIAPHAGYTYSGATAGAAYARLEGAPCERIVVLAPSHSVAFDSISTGTYVRLATPVGDVPVDVAACMELVAAADSVFVPRIDTHQDEHALGTQLPLLATLFPGVPVVPLVCGQLSKDTATRAAELLARMFPEESTLWVASSDFTHFGASFGFCPFTHDVHERIEEMDREGIDCILALDGEGFREFLERTGATICGREPIGVLIGILRRLGIPGGKLIEYTSSGRATGDERHSVSYAAISFGEGSAPEAEGLAKEEQVQALQLARQAISSSLLERKEWRPDLAELAPALREIRACFVTLHIDGELRGCIGEMEGRVALAESIVNNARNAAFTDWRFQPLTAPEFEKIHIEISVLSPLRQIDDLADFVIGTHGIRLEKGRHAAVFLPQVAPEQGWDQRTTLEHLCRKAGMKADAWQRGTTFKVFTAQVFGEEH